MGYQHEKSHAKLLHPGVGNKGQELRTVLLRMSKLTDNYITM
jgi:hypothetical protein